MVNGSSGCSQLKKNACDTVVLQILARILFLVKQSGISQTI